MNKKTKVDSRGKRIGMFDLKTIVYLGILMALMYLYEHSGLTSVHFIYNECYGRCLHMIQDVIKKIEEIAANEPERIVYDYLDETNTYGDLKQRSNAWTHKIASLDIPKDAPIMIWGG